MNRITLDTQLPVSGEAVKIVVQPDVIGVRVGDRIALAHHRWMSLEEARQALSALERLVPEGRPAAEF